MWPQLTKPYRQMPVNPSGNYKPALSGYLFEIFNLQLNQLLLSSELIIKKMTNSWSKSKRIEREIKHVGRLPQGYVVWRRLLPRFVSAIWVDFCPTVGPHPKKCGRLQADGQPITDQVKRHTLKDFQIFSAVKFEPELDTIVWDNGADFAPEFLYELARKQKDNRSA